mmetsp:Transcript_74346/g.177340  ORF Transcript_74346/g.177340 Transcript_74346/m.177340 type:complete len:262 (+) Transcript_74346:3289-4074(+)
MAMMDSSATVAAWAKSLCWSIVCCAISLPRRWPKNSSIGIVAQTTSASCQPVIMANTKPPMNCAKLAMRKPSVFDMKKCTLLISASSLAATPAGSCSSYQLTSKERRTPTKLRCQRLDCLAAAQARQLCQRKPKRNWMSAIAPILMRIGPILFITLSGSRACKASTASAMNQATAGVDAPWAKAKTRPKFKTTFSQYFKCVVTTAMSSSEGCRSCLQSCPFSMSCRSRTGCCPRRTGRASFSDMAEKIRNKGKRVFSNQTI